MRVKIKSRVKELVAIEEQEERRQISGRELARHTGLSQNTVGNLALNRTRRVDLHVLERLLEYFDSRGRDYGLDDLFEVVRE